MEKIRYIIILVGACLATISIGGSGVGIAVVFAALINSYSRTSIHQGQLFTYIISGFVFTETLFSRFFLFLKSFKFQNSFCVKKTNKYLGCLLIVPEPQPITYFFFIIIFLIFIIFFWSILYKGKTFSFKMVEILLHHLITVIENTFIIKNYYYFGQKILNNIVLFHIPFHLCLLRFNSILTFIIKMPYLYQKMKNSAVITKPISYLILRSCLLVGIFFLFLKGVSYFSLHCVLFLEECGIIPINNDVGNLISAFSESSWQLISFCLFILLYLYFALCDFSQYARQGKVNISWTLLQVLLRLLIFSCVIYLCTLICIFIIFYTNIDFLPLIRIIPEYFVIVNCFKAAYHLWYGELV